VVVGAIVVGSSLILRIADLPIPGYISVLATLGYVVAVIVGFYAVYSALRHGRSFRR
jgi:ubiquinone biosynthesis protein